MGIKERKERERERTRQQLIVAAQRVSMKKDFNLVTMEDIAREAGSRSQYRYNIPLFQILWSLFSGIVLCESSKKIIDDNKDYLKQTLGIAFEIFQKGIIIE